MFDKLFANTAKACNARFPKGCNSPAFRAYIMRRYEALAMPQRPGAARFSVGGQGSRFSRQRKGAALAAAYDRRYALSDAYYARNTSDWAGR